MKIKRCWLHWNQTKIPLMWVQKCIYDQQLQEFKKKNQVKIKIDIQDLFSFHTNIIFFHKMQLALTSRFRMHQFCCCNCRLYRNLKILLNITCIYCALCQLVALTNLTIGFDYIWEFRVSIMMMMTSSKLGCCIFN